MKGRITSIDEPKLSRNNDVAFRRIHLILETGEYVMTDIVSTYRNYRHWEPIIESGVGTYVGGIRLKDKDKVDADSVVYIIQRPNELEHPKLDL